MLREAATPWAEQGPHPDSGDHPPKPAPLRAPLRVALFIPSFAFGGCERQFAILLTQFDRKRIQPCAIVAQAGGPLEAGLAEADVPIFSLDKKSTWDLAAYGRRLPRILQAWQPDILFATTGTPEVVAALLKRGSGAFRVVWGIGASAIDLRCYSWRTRLMHRLHFWLRSRVDLIIYNSEAGRRDWQNQGLIGVASSVIANGFDGQQFRFDAEARQRLRQEWRIPAHAHVVGAVGRLDPQKDYPNLLHAIGQLRDQEMAHRFHLVIVGPGSGEAREKLLALATSLGLSEALHLPGPNPSIAQVYSAFDAYCSSSAFGEGLQNTVGEAMACGLPCVLTDVGDARRLAGETAVLVPAQDSAALAAGLRMVLLGGGAGLGTAARERILKHFSLTQTVQQTEDALCGLALTSGSMAPR